MSGFTKLVPEIVQSSIWNEPSDIRIVWITMLAVKDESGYVRGDARTIARLANVPTESAEKALSILQDVDPSSHTPDNDGRRIEPLNGGWVVLNHDLYRGRDHKAEHAAYVRDWRDKKKQCESQVNHSESQGNHTSASASVSASVSTSDERGGCKGGVDANYTQEFIEFWQAYPNRKGKKSAWRAWKSAKDRPPTAELIAEIKLQCRSVEWTKDGGAFIPHPATWINRAGWEDEVMPIPGEV